MSFSSSIRFEPCDLQECQVCCEHVDQECGHCIDCGFYENGPAAHSACGQEK